MAENRRIVQLHKKDDTSELWIPINTGECVEMTDYVNNGETGSITQIDNLNTALAKLENTKADAGESLADYNITDAYTKDEIDILLSGIYHVHGSLASTDIHSTLLDSDTKTGDVYNLSDDTVLTNDFIEYEGVATPISAGTNIVVVNTGTNENPVYKFDMLAMNISSAIQAATSTALGGIKIGYTDNTTGTRNYPVSLDNNDKAFVNVPWANTEYSLGLNGNTLSLTPSTGTAQTVTLPSVLPDGTNKSGKCLKVVDNSGTLSWEDDLTATYTAGVGLDLNNGTFKVKLNSETSLGTIGTTPKLYAVGVDSNGKLCTNVTWDNTHYTATPVLGATNATANATAATNNDATYMNIVENNAKSGGIQIIGTGLVSVSAKDGVLTVVGTDPIPSQTGHNNKFLSTNGTTLSWATPSDLNTFRVIQVDNTQLLATDSNKAFDIIGGRNVTLTTDNTQSGYASVTIDVPITDNKPTVTNSAASIAFKYGNNYFVGASAYSAPSVNAGSAVTTLTITDGNGVNDSTDFEANVFFKAGDNASGMTVTLPSGFLLIGEEPEYVSGNVYLVSFYKGTAIFGEMTVV